MSKHNPENERIKRKYFAYLKAAKRHSEPTVDAVAKALNSPRTFPNGTVHYSMSISAA